MTYEKISKKLKKHVSQCVKISIGTVKYQNLFENLYPHTGIGELKKASKILRPGIF